MALTEEYEYVAELTFNTTQKLYELFITTYNGQSVGLNAFLTTRRHNMRMDLISNDIYQSNKWVGTLCQLNNYVNPFAVRENEFLFYPSADEAQNLLRVREAVKNPGFERLIGQVRAELKQAILDQNKNNFNSGRANDALPPTVPAESSPSIVIENEFLKIAPNLFVNPNNEVLPAAPQATPSLDNRQGDRVERVLINRYIQRLQQ